MSEYIYICRDHDNDNTCMYIIYDYIEKTNMYSKETSEYMPKKKISDFLPGKMSEWMSGGEMPEFLSEEISRYQRMCHSIFSDLLSQYVSECVRTLSYNGGT